MTQAEVLHELDCNTHILFTAAFLNEVNEAFGTSIKPMTYTADAPANPKGLTLYNERSHAIGVACFDLAMMLCDALKVKYPSTLGRGFQVRACTTALKAAGYGK